MADDEETKTEKDNSKMKMLFSVIIAIIIRILQGRSIWYLIFGPRSRIIDEIINGDDVSEITDPKDSYSLIDVSKPTERSFYENRKLNFSVYEIEEKIGNYVQNKSFPVKLFCKGDKKASKAKETILIVGYKNVVNFGGIETSIIKVSVLIGNRIIYCRYMRMNTVLTLAFIFISKSIISYKFFINNLWN